MKKYFVLHPAVFKLDGGAMFGIIPKPLWSKVIPSDELNRIEMSLRVMLIQTNSKNILIDTGIGDYHGEKFDDRFGVRGEENPLIKMLKDHFNLGPSDITDVVLSHLHFDHVGGLGTDLNNHQTLFGNARLHIHKKHYDYSLNPTLRDAGSFHSHYFKNLIEQADLNKQVNWLTEDEGELIRDGSDIVFFKCSHGHTPWLIHPYDEKFIYMADLVPTSAHISVPWVMGYDIAPGQTTIDKTNFYDFIIKNNLTMIFEHDMNIWGAKIRPRGTNDFEISQKFTAASLDPLKGEVFFD